MIYIHVYGIQHDLQDPSASSNSKTIVERIVNGYHLASAIRVSFNWAPKFTYMYSA